MSLSDLIGELFNSDINDFFFNTKHVSSIRKIDDAVVSRYVRFTTQSNSSDIDVYTTNPNFKVESLRKIKVTNPTNTHRLPCRIIICSNVASSCDLLVNGEPHNIVLCTPAVKLSLKLNKSCNIIVGQGTTSGNIAIHGGLFSLSIKKDCLFSDGINFQMRDQHPLFDIKTGQNINDHDAWGEVSVGIHSWIGRNVTILKNSSIADGGVVGTSSVLTKDIVPFSVFAGVPAKLKKSDAIWLRFNKISAVEKKIFSELGEKHDVDFSKFL
ncbi:hypothetical protein ACJJIF_04620 [Microbulbifer sp. SSSA002]|uniref:hypothetical protein n=1 Tax=Microbulbifer sp. SSSA002 TaxID=3243376 RepID=UPI00403A142F